MDSKMLLAQKARTINKSTREERQRLREAEKQLREKGRIAPIANEPMVGCKSWETNFKIEQTQAKIDAFDKKN